MHNTFMACMLHNGKAMRLIGTKLHGRLDIVQEKHFVNVKISLLIYVLHTLALFLHRNNIINDSRLLI